MLSVEPGIPEVAQAMFALGGDVLIAQSAYTLFGRALHIISAIVIGGGIFYMRTVLSPSGADACFAGRRQVWAKWVGIFTFVLLASGIFNLITIIKQAKADGGELPSTYHMLFGVKVLLALFVLFVAAILAGKTDAAEKFRANIATWLNLAWFAVMAIVVLGAILRSMH